MEIAAPSHQLQAALLYIIHVLTPSIHPLKIISCRVVIRKIRFYSYVHGVLLIPSVSYIQWHMLETAILTYKRINATNTNNLMKQRSPQTHLKHSELCIIVF